MSYTFRELQFVDEDVSAVLYETGEDSRRSIVWQKMFYTSYRRPDNVVAKQKHLLEQFRGCILNNRDALLCLQSDNEELLTLAEWRTNHHKDNFKHDFIKSGRIAEENLIR